METKHIYSSDKKLEAFGYGEWVEEPDEVYFIHKGIECRILRVVQLEEHETCYWFGGHLCGYIKIPEDHQFYNKDYDDIPLNAYCGLTYSQMEKDGYWVGFDCMHAFDIIPSIARKRKFDPLWIELTKEMNAVKSKMRIKDSCATTYKNINFVEMQCRALADQLIEAQLENSKKKE